MLLNKGRPWTRDEIIIAINFYCKTPFGKLHRTNPEIINLARHLNRTPSALAMKLVNFASLDPAQKRRNIKGLSNVSKLDDMVWGEFYSNWEMLAYESQKAIIKLQGTPHIDFQPDEDTPTLVNITHRDTEKTAMTRVRLVQGFFRNAVLASYGNKCSFCEMGLTQLLCASHIIPWKDNVVRRADPTNGICLCVLHDKAFDRGLLGIGDDFRILVSHMAMKKSPSILHKVGLQEIAGQPINLPKRFKPDSAAIEHHRNNIFIG